MVTNARPIMKNANEKPDAGTEPLTSPVPLSSHQTSVFDTYSSLTYDSDYERAEEEALDGKRLMGQLRRELRGSINTDVPVFSLLQTYFPDTYGIVPEVLEWSSLHHHHLRRFALLTEGDSTTPPICLRFVNLLNTLLEKIRNVAPSDKDSCHSYLEFRVLGSTPDQDGTSSFFASSLQSTSWSEYNDSEVSTFGFIHHSLDVMTYTAANQLRKLTGTHLRRFAVSMMLLEETCELHVTILHLGSLWVSQAIPLIKDTGLDALVQLLVGVHSWKDAWAAGVDPTRTANKIALPGWRIYKIENSICRRNAFGGCGTAVDLVRRLPPPRRSRKSKSKQPGQDAISMMQQEHTSSRNCDSRYTSNLSNATLTPSYPWDDTHPLHVFAPGMDPESWPNALIIKDSYSESTDPNDYLVFGGMGDQFGLAKVLTAFEVGGGTQRSPRFNGLGKSIHLRTVIGTIGSSLTSAESPRILIQGVLHAMLGYWNLVDHGWLHRDISVGNVLLLRTPEARTPVTMFGERALIETRGPCRGMIIDADLAVKVGYSGAELKHCSGTIPFLSQRLLKLWAKRQSAVHTALDDLESFVFVLVWAVHFILENRHLLGLFSLKLWTDYQQSDNLVSVIEKRRNLLQYWAQPPMNKPETAAWAVWRPLVAKLNQLIHDARLDLGQHFETQGSIDNMLRLGKEYCKLYVTALLEALDDGRFAASCRWDANHGPL